MQEWEDICQRIADELTLCDPDSVPVAEFLLHIENNDAWWRWSDEPFDQADDEPVSG